MPADDPLSVIDVAKMLGLKKEHAFKVIDRLGIQKIRQPHKAHKGQAIAYITATDFALVKQYVESQRGAENQTTPTDSDIATIIEVGVFYVIQLEPEHDAGRFKVGFAANIGERLRAHRCSAPFAVVVKTWPCKRLWERTAIDCVTSHCEQLYTEVFRCVDLGAVIEKCDRFFGIMPDVTEG